MGSTNLTESHECMVIISTDTGQLANRLLIFCHFIANAVEYDYALYHPFFHEYAPYFEATSTNNFLGQKISAKPVFKNETLNKLAVKGLKAGIYVLSFVLPKTPFYQIFQIITTNDKTRTIFDLNHPDFIATCKRKKVFVQGWHFRDFTHFNKHSDLLRTLFRPKAAYLDNVNSLISRCRQNYDVLIGIHIRLGDYLTHQGGKFYFTQEAYRNYMVQIKDQCKAPEQRILFVICSNGEIDREVFSGLNVELGTNHFIEDLVTLSSCDFILGPPSTFSMWASFYGKVPLFHINKEIKNVKLDEFKVYPN